MGAPVFTALGEGGEEKEGASGTFADSETLSGGGGATKPGGIGVEEGVGVSDAGAAGGGGGIRFEGGGGGGRTRRGGCSAAEAEAGVGFEGKLILAVSRDALPVVPGAPARGGRVIRTVSFLGPFESLISREKCSGERAGKCSICHWLTWRGAVVGTFDSRLGGVCARPAFPIGRGADWGRSHSAQPAGAIWEDRKLRIPGRCRRRFSAGSPPFSDPP